MKICNGSAVLAMLTLSMGFATTEAAADSKIPALHAGTYCFQVGETIPGGPIRTVKLSVTPTGIGSEYPVGRVNGYWHKSQVTSPPFLSVYAPLTGTVVTAPENGRSGSTAELLNFGLTSVSSGPSADAAGTPGLWAGTYTLNLDPATLNGRAVFEVTFTSIASGAAPTTAVVEAEDLPVTKMSCSDI
jgi:hypothetical protein